MARLLIFGLACFLRPVIIAYPLYVYRSAVLLFPLASIAGFVAFCYDFYILGQACRPGTQLLAVHMWMLYDHMQGHAS
jgi:hypothetical protein